MKAEGLMESGWPGQTRGRILLIDDDPTLGAYLARVLQTHGHFEVSRELGPASALIEEVITEVQPTVGYAHGIHDVRQDHRNAHRAAMVAARKVGQVYCQSPSATIDFRRAHFMPIDRYIGVKLSTIDMFGSQVAVRDYLEPAVIEPTARYWARFGGDSPAEAFEVVRHWLRVLVTGAGGPAAIAVMKSLGRDDSVELLAADVDVVVPTVDAELRPLARDIFAAAGIATARASGLIVQEFLPGQEYSIDVLADSSGYVIAAVPRIWERVDSGVSVGGRTVHDSELERSALDSLFGRPVPRQMNFREPAVIRFLDERFIDPAEITATRMVMA
jgi:hypothetical protein